MSALRLVCSGDRAHARSSLQQQKFRSLIKQLTEEALLYSQNVPGLADGEHRLVYEGRGARRDVYRVGGTLILKLIRPETEVSFRSMENESRALKQTASLPQTPTLHYQGPVDIHSPNSVTLTVECLLMSYGGPSYDKLLHEWCARPFNLVVANFFFSAIFDLITMMFDGQTLDIGYGDMHTGNISTLSNPGAHVPGNNVPSVICDAEAVSGTRWKRSVFNGVCEDMVSDFRLHFSNARDESWCFLSGAMSTYLADFFKQNGNDPLDSVRDLFLQRLQLMWRKVCNAQSQVSAVSSQHYAESNDVDTPSSPDAAHRQKVERAISSAPWRKQSAGATAPSVLVAPELPLPAPLIGMLLCGHTVDAIDSTCAACERYSVQQGAVGHPAMSEDQVIPRFDPPAEADHQPAVASQRYAPVKSRPSTGPAIPGCGHAVGDPATAEDQVVPRFVPPAEADHQLAVASQRYAPVKSSPLTGHAIPGCGHMTKPQPSVSSHRCSPTSSLQEEVDWGPDEATRSSLKRPSSFPSPEAKRSSPFDAVERKRTSPFDAKESTRLVLREAVHCAASGSADSSTGGWRLTVSPQEAFEQRYAEPIAEAARRELESQRSSTFRGGGRFQEDRVGRMSWEDRKAADVFEREPQMTQAESDDVNRLCKIMYLALHNVLNRIPLTKKNKKQRRVEKESEFSKYGMAMRVFKYLKRYTYNQDHWCNPKAVFEIVLIEFDRLVHGQVAIPNFKFHDEYEREFLARVVTRGFLSGGLLREREMVLCER